MDAVLPFFALGIGIDASPLVHRLHDRLPDYYPEWVKWGLILTLVISLYFLVVQLSNRVREWWINRNKFKLDKRDGRWN